MATTRRLVTRLALSFVEEFKTSTILQAALTIMMWGATIYMWIARIPVPPELTAADTLTLGFYFGSKVKQLQQQAANGSS